MNKFLPSRYLEHIQDLALGVEPVDACRQGRVPPPLFMVRDAPLTDAGRARLRQERRHATAEFPRLRRSNTCRFALLYSEVVFKSSQPWVRVRLVQGFSDFAPRHFVPRRLQIPLQDPVVADAQPLAKRIHRPALFPGADYPIHDTATGVRGRVLRGGKPLRWARVEAQRIADNRVVARAHGDDRGEFLLILDSNAAVPGAQLWLTVRLFVFAPEPAPTPPTSLEAETDPLWDLPIEALPLSAAETNAVARGEYVPAHYTSSTTRDLTLRLGTLSSDSDPYIIP